MDENVQAPDFFREPRDLKRLTNKQLEELAHLIRRKILHTVDRNGGHLASNLGVVELAIALHRVFESPRDKIIWDVGHQCYAHKLLTGRWDAFDTLRQAGGVSGFPRREESPHDVFNVGHASTSVSVALGFLAKEMLAPQATDTSQPPRAPPERSRCIAIIGDGALTGGIAYEALSHAGQLRMPLIVILNDNCMSISPNVGGLSEYLSRLSMKPRYQSFRRNFDALVQQIPLVGNHLLGAILRLKRAIKAVFYHDNFFVDLGFEYVGPIEGHNLRHLEKVLIDVSALNRPVVVHVLTQKGRGFAPAERDPRVYHAVSGSPNGGGGGSPQPTAPPPGLSDTPLSGGHPRNAPGHPWTKVFSDALIQAARKDSRIVAISAAMEHGTGLSAFKTEFPDRFFDVGIAEEHAVTFAAALAAAELKPVVAIYSTFIQRAVDQIIHDAALQNLPVIFAVDRAGFVAGDGETHQGLFDISIFRAIPNITLLCPAVASELPMMLNWALEKATGPCAIRYPKAEAPLEAAPGPCQAPLELGRGIFLSVSGAIPNTTPVETAADPSVSGTNETILLAFTGSLYSEVVAAAEILAGQGIKTDLYNLRFLKPIDEPYLCKIMNRYQTIVFIEEGLKNGGIGEYAAGLAAQNKVAAKILGINAGDTFYSQATRSQLLKTSGLDAASLAGLIAERHEAYRR
jgi:1-deoxy-D-xylulose-5-phosphate synthase